MNPPLIRLGAIGAGRVFERLYVPAIARVPGFTLAAVADPDSAARQRVGPAIAAFATAEELVASRLADAILVLSPGHLHAKHAAVALAQGLPILLEKPSATSVAELEAWPEAYKPLVTPARPRRYWPRYLAIRRALQADEPFTLVLHTSPAAWGASHESSPIDDLLPHIIDLAEWLSRSHIERISGAVSPERADGLIHLEDLRDIAWSTSHSGAYEEYVQAGATSYRLDRLSLRERIEKRLRGTLEQEQLGAWRMLRLWERRLRGRDVAALPGFESALLEVRLREQLLASPGPSA